MWVLLHSFFRVGNADERQHFNRLFPRFLFVAVLVNHNGFGNLPADGEHRVETGHRLLKNHGDIVAAHLAHFTNRQLEQVLSMEQNLAADNFARRGLHQPHDGQRSDAFAAARFAHDAQRLSFFDGKGDVVDSLDDTVFGVEIGLKVFNLYQFFQASPSPSLSAGGQARRAARPRRC